MRHVRSPGIGPIVDDAVRAAIRSRELAVENTQQLDKLPEPGITAHLQFEPDALLGLVARTTASHVHPGDGCELPQEGAKNLVGLVDEVRVRHNQRIAQVRMAQPGVGCTRRLGLYS